MLNDEKLFEPILDRLKEPSTYAGLSAIMIAFGVTLCSRFLGK